MNLLTSEYRALGFCHYFNFRIAHMLSAGLSAAVLTIACIAEAPANTGSTGRDQTAIGAAEPALLSTSDLALYREIFSVQETGKWQTADRLIKQVDNPLLAGHVQAQRYLHPTRYRSSYKELKRWLDKYADHPQAYRIYKLALKRYPKGWKRPKPPVGNILSGNGYDYGTARPYQHQSTLKLNRKDRARAAKLKRRIRQRIRDGWPTGALKLLQGPQGKLLDPVHYHEQLARIATGYYHFGKPDEALAFASEAAAKAPGYVPEAHWTAGLTAWRLGKLDRARSHFAQLARLKSADDWDRTAGAYWVSRIDLRQGRVQQVSDWLYKAAAYPQTFYGLMAIRALGLERSFDWDRLAVTPERLALLHADISGRRALALWQVGRRDEAERELRKLAARASDEVLRAVLAFSDKAGFTGLTLRIGAHIAQSTGQIVVSALYPMPGWEPQNGFEVDRALIYAFIRQESHFNPTARSSAGARGLMQLMPATARYIAGRRLNRSDLYNPEFNLSLGQKYIRYLLDQPAIDGDLFRLLAAYNGGIGNLRRWQKTIDWALDDPLLFIESIPSRETRLFVEKVMSNLWLYRVRMAQDLPSLSEIAAGSWPSYAALDRAMPVVSGQGSGV